MKPARLVSTLMPASLPFADGGGGSRNPNAASPNTPSPTTTRAMVLEGSLEFGTVQIGSASERRFRIYNNGNAVMAVTALTVPTGCELLRGLAGRRHSAGDIPRRDDVVSSVRRRSL